MEWFQTYQGEGLLVVHVEVPDNVGVETSLVIRSLQAALENAIRADERFAATTPSPVAIAL